ncbi:TRAP transporter small permease subunit [Aestuariirhabdus sp. Z084]|uniref:TRAP transporter small permease subunit n=1 Tax=Aestuariirhabdus haliotis TaxID=2918751 RepID=UPI00201B425D|nr:TRAP transporter small permease subunit [Aestuariirhabdus haliotis]MCL6414407.1 TRAP transporter small permease subunit [Aestuariirhabdus haliotis]MCL6418339.1 TRAP transporter small permease subunit [Aestuariirhabdus haliotis]
MSDLEGFGFVMPHWLYWGWLAVMPLIMIYLDRRSNATSDEVSEEAPIEPAQAEETSIIVHEEIATPVTRVIDWISEHSGLFVAFWTVNAVCFYFFEVVMRYLFNMPTIWVHEASFLMLGMQYLLAGSYAMLHGAHVRVDVVYNKLPPRGRVGMDIFTSLFFFIFALALAGTSWTFFIDSFNMSETTVETWGIQYWPVKGMMFLGSSLILLSGISKLIKDILLFVRLGQGVH